MFDDRALPPPGHPMRRCALGLGLFAVLDLMFLHFHTVDAGSDVSGAIGSLNAPEARGTGSIVAGDRLIEILETVEDNKNAVLRVANSDTRYRVRPIASFTANGRQCRTFTLRRLGSTNARESLRTACRTPNGDWNVSKIPDPVSHP